MSCKKVAPPSSGTFPTDGTVFIVLLVGVVIVVGALTFFPVVRAGAGPRAALHDCRTAVLGDDVAENDMHNHDRARRERSFDAAIVGAGGARRRAQARSARHEAQPRHVRGRDRQRGLDVLRRRCDRRWLGDAGFIWAVSAWLWFTVLFANFAEAMAEGRGKAQADTLRAMKTDTVANVLDAGDDDRGRLGLGASPRRHGRRRGRRDHPG